MIEAVSRRTFLKHSAAWSACAALGGAFCTDAVGGMRPFEGALTRLTSLADPGVFAGKDLLVADVSGQVRFECFSAGVDAGAFSLCQARERIAAAWEAGFETIPLLNLSPFRESWPVAAAARREAIFEVAALFGRPRFVHLGMNGDVASLLRAYRMDAFDRERAYWDILEEAVPAVEACGARAWVWADFAEWHPELFLRRMSRNVVVSPWCPGRFAGHGFSLAPAHRGCLGRPLRDAFGRENEVLGYLAT